MVIKAQFDIGIDTGSAAFTCYLGPRFQLALATIYVHCRLDLPA